MDAEQAGHYVQLFGEAVAGVDAPVVCETGFFRGGTALLWLLLHPQSTVHSFDMQFHPQALVWFEGRYPGRLHAHAVRPKCP